MDKEGGSQAAKIIDDLDKKYKFYRERRLPPENFAEMYLNAARDLDEEGLADHPDIAPFLKYFGRLPEIYTPRVITLENLRAEDFKRSQDREHIRSKPGDITALVMEVL